MTTTNTPERATARAELLPCPFCGAPCQHPWNYGDTRDGLHRFVECTKCGANMYRFRQTQDEADAALYEAWNARINTHDALQAENARLREQVKELRERLSAMVTAKALKGVREIVSGWNGEGKADGPYERHPSKLGATLPKTNCGAVYELDEAMCRARALPSPQVKP